MNIEYVVGAVVVAGILFNLREIRALRIEVTKWRVHLFGMDGRSGLTGDVRKLQGRGRRKYDDMESDI